jgi:hydrophobic/amphiphilic exporter-1 (mainly G- bacteria), HAE1 family
MWISSLAIRRPITAIVAMLVLSLAGLLALGALETDEMPDVQAPMVTVTVPYPGASPAQVERELLRPLEERVRGVAGIKKVQGTAGDGYALLFAEFIFSTSAGDAMQSTRDAVSAARGELPSESKEPIIERFSETDLPVLSLAMGGPGNALALSADARRLARELRSVPGVAQVRVVGDAVPELAVRVRPDAMRAAGVTVAMLTDALGAQNVSIPIGRLEQGATEQVLRFDGRPADLDAFRALTLRSASGSVVRVGDVADLSIAPAESRSAALINGSPAVTLDIRKRRGASMTTVADAVRERVERARAGLPAGRSLSIVQDAGLRTGQAVWDVQKTILEGALLTILVVFVFLNSWRSTVITGLALPVSVLASFVAVWAFGFKLETMSLMGLSLSIGVLIDDAIVVRENIVRHVEMGKDHRRAAEEGTKEIGLAVLATTAAIAVVFLPVGFMSGLAGQYFKPFALTVSAAVLVSLFVSFTLDPMLSAYWPDPHTPMAERSWISRQLGRFNSWFDGLAVGYRRLVQWALAHRAATMGIAAASLVIAVALPMTGIVGAEFSPVDDRSELGVTVESPPGSSLAYTRARAEAIAAIARTHPEVRTTYVTVGGSEDVTQAMVQVLLHPRATRTRSARDLVGVLRAQSRSLTGASYSVLEGSFGGVVKPLQLQVLGVDAATLPAVAATIAERLRRVPGAVDVSLSSRPGQPALDVSMARGVAGAIGVAPVEVASALRAAFAGVEAGEWVDREGELRKVVVRFPSEARREARDLDRLPLLVADPTGATHAVAFRQVATTRSATAPTKIEHDNGAASVTIAANIEGRPLGAVSSAIDDALAEMTLPAGITVRWAGDVSDQREIFTNILIALGIAVVGMYFVLVLQFNSWIEPLAILMSLPLSAIGVTTALAITGATINIMSMIGMILLAGVVAKNAILLLEFARQLRESGMSLVDALAESGATRLRPIVMTTVALVAGMIPVAIGSGEGAQFRAPLGIAVIGGTIASTALTLLVIPVVYALLDAARARMQRPNAARRGVIAVASHAQPIAG